MEGRTPLTLAAIAEHVGGTVEGAGDVVVTGVAGLDDAGEGDLTFLANAKYQSSLQSTAATAVLLSPDQPCPAHLKCVRTKDPYAAVMQVLRLFDPGAPAVGPGVHATAVVAPDAELGPDVDVGAGTVIEAGARIGRGTRIAALSFVGAGARLGEDCYLHPRTYVAHHCRLGNRVVLYPGAVIGSDGFGYAPVEGRYHKIPQLGTVELGDDVEIGANACVDRATMGCTRIGRGTKIDNLVMVAHNVAIGEDGVIAAQTGISGSTKLGDRLRMGGQVGVIGHLRIGNDVTVSAKGGLIGDVADGEMVSGFPARPHKEWLRGLAALRRLPGLLQRWRTEGGAEPNEEGGSQ